jgi:hypothetical protein
MSRFIRLESGEEGKLPVYVREDKIQVVDVFEDEIRIYMEDCNEEDRTPFAVNRTKKNLMLLGLDTGDAEE